MKHPSASWKRHSTSTYAAPCARTVRVSTARGSPATAAVASGDAPAASLASNSSTSRLPAPATDRYTPHWEKDMETMPPANFATSLRFRLDSSSMIFTDDLRHAGGGRRRMRRG
jgi:hypothetical protein